MVADIGRAIIKFKKKISEQMKRECWRGCGEKGTLVHCWWECRLVWPLWKTVWNFLRKLKVELHLYVQSKEQYK